MRFSAGWLAGWAGVYLALLLLLLLSVAVRARSELEGSLHLDEIPQPLVQRVVELRGVAEPLSILRLAVNGRLHATDFTVRKRFRFEVELPREARDLRLTAVSSEGETLGRVDQSIRWAPGAFDLEERFCLGSESHGLLWVVATGTPGEWVSVEAETADQPGEAAAQPMPVRSGHLDDFGVLDLERDLDGAPPAAVLVRRSDDPSAAVSLACRALPEGEPFPLTRRVVLEHERDLPSVVRSLDELRVGRSDEAAAQIALLLALMPVARVEVVLPASHPYVEQLLFGWRSPRELLQSTVGSLDGVPGAGWIESLKQQARSRGLAVPDLAPSVRVTTRGDEAVIKLTTRLVAFLEPFGGQELRLRRGLGEGVASRPLLTERDSLAMRLAAADRWWFDHIPTGLEPEEAVWRGPLTTFDEIAASRAIPAHLSEMLEPRGSEALPQSPQEEQTMRDFVRAVERAERPGFARLLWGALLALVPVLVLAWLLRREPFAGAPASGRLLAFAAVGAALLIAPMLQSVITRFVGELLGRSLFETLTPLYEPFSATAFGDVTRPLSDAPRTALWIALIGVVGAVPLYLDGLTARLAAPAMPRRRSGPLRRALGVLRGAYVVALVALLWMLARPRLSTPLLDRLNELFATLADPLQTVSGTTVTVLVIVSALLCAAGWRGLLFVAAFWAALGVLVAGEGLGLLAEVPGWAAWMAAILAGLAALPLLSRLLAVVVPADWRRGSRPWVAAALAATAVAVLHLPPRLPLLVGGGVLTLGLLWPLVRLVAELPATSGIARLVDGRTGAVAVVLVTLGVVLGWPVPAADVGLAPADVSALAFHWRKLVPSLIGVGLALLVWRRIADTGRRILSSRELVAAGALYAVFLIGPTTTWLGVVPIPLLVAICIARYGLFVSSSTHDELLAADLDASVDFRRLARTFVASEVPRRRSEAAIRSLSKQLEQASISPQEYEKRAADYRHFWGVAEEAASPRLAFALGDRRFGASVGAFVGIGLALATGPIVISLYQYLPVSRVNHPFPVADFMTFLLAAILKWGLYAAFFGLLFANLRGATGLTKGLHLFLAIGIPFAASHLLGAASAEDLRPFLFWITQLFVFFGLLGLIAGDLRLLKLAGSSARELRFVHRLPALYAFGSTVTAAILPSLLAVVAGKLGEVVKFFMEMVVPGTGGP